MLSKRTEAWKKADYLYRQGTSFIDQSLRAWYMLGQKWFDMEGRIDDEVISELPETQQGAIMMGFNAAQWAWQTGSQPAVRGTASQLTGSGNRSMQWYD